MSSVTDRDASPAEDCSHPAAGRRTISVVDAGEVDYATAHAWQDRLVEARARRAVGDVVLLLTHPRVYTAGPRADLSANLLDAGNIPVQRTDRAGDVTYHGPGQLVAYPIVRLSDPRAVRDHVAALQRAGIRLAAAYGISAHPPPAQRDDQGKPLTGVWVGSDKLAAVGVRVTDGITKHGMAVNVDPDLSDFAGIVACGLAGAGTTSLAAHGANATVDGAAAQLAPILADELEAEPVPADAGAATLRPPTGASLSAPPSRVAS